MARSMVITTFSSEIRAMLRFSALISGGILQALMNASSIAYSNACPSILLVPR